MKLSPLSFSTFATIFWILSLSSLVSSTAFVSPATSKTRCHSSTRSLIMNAENKQHPYCDLPGDPSLILTTNVDLGDKKLEIMKAISKAICSRTGKPESYIAVSINDKADVIFGGSDEPTALGCVYSIGAIATESNGQITSDVSELLAPYGVADNRIYINFFDMPRGNVGWSKRTFAG